MNCRFAEAQRVELFSIVAFQRVLSEHGDIKSEKRKKAGFFIEANPSPEGALAWVRWNALNSWRWNILR
jgi:hypothetical protein